MLADRLLQSAASFSDPAERMRHFADFYHPKAVFHGYVRDMSLDFLSARDFYAGLWSAFPDFRVRICHAVEDGEMIGFHYVWEGTHRGPFSGITPSNRQVRVEGMGLMRFEAQQVIERWNVSDSRSLMVQLRGQTSETNIPRAPNRRSVMVKRRYMVIEKFRNGDAMPVYQRFRQRGRMVPAGLTYLSSWVSDDLKRCYQLMETNDRVLLDEWMSNWSDLVEFELHPVISPEEATRKVDQS